MRVRTVAGKLWCEVEAPFPQFIKALRMHFPVERNEARSEGSVPRSPSDVILDENSGF